MNEKNFVINSAIMKEHDDAIHLGDKVRITDPCYNMDTWCAGTLENVLPGVYRCFSYREPSEGRIAGIEIRNIAFFDVEPTEITDIDVGVDSGQCGIFDLEYFKKNSNKDDNGPNSAWYNMIGHLTFKQTKNPMYKRFSESSIGKGFSCCDYSLERIAAEEKFMRTDEAFAFICELAAASVEGMGFVSSSGYGDGSYTCIIGRNPAGQIVSILIVYISSDEDEIIDDTDEGLTVSEKET